MHSRIRVFVAVIFLTALGTACGKKKTSETVFPREKAECLPSAIPNHFIVHWEDERISFEHGLDREEFIESFVKPQLDKIKKVEPNRRIPTPLGTGLELSPATIDNWGQINIGLDSVWQKSIRGQGITVAVIDTGVDITHWQLKDRIAINEGESGLDANGNDKRFNQIDDDQNGYKDDYTGYNFFLNSGETFDSGLHGTHVSGIILAAHGDMVAGESNRVQGVAPEAKVLPLAFLNGDKGGTLEDAIRAIDYAALRKVDIINASWGGSACSTILGERIRRLASEEILFVSAAGNRGVDIDKTSEFPAAFNMPSQITVGSIGRMGAMAEHSNYGKVHVHLFAPGVEVYSTIPDQKVAGLTGTSMATPFVSGALALIKSHRPEASVDSLRSALFESVSVGPFYRNSTRGRLNLSNAIEVIEALYPRTSTSPAP